MESRLQRWVRYVLVVVGAPHLLIGAWALAAPKGWFDSFPGIDPRFVAAEPPYNQHLASDVGAAFLAAGVVLVVAAVIANRAALYVALSGLVAFTLPHVVYHAAHPADALSDAANVMNVLLLSSGLLWAAVLSWAVRGEGRQTTRASRNAAISPST